MTALCARMSACLADCQLAAVLTCMTVSAEHQQQSFAMPTMKHYIDKIEKAPCECQPSTPGSLPVVTR